MYFKKIEEKQLNKKQVLNILLVIPISFLIFGIIMGDLQSIILQIKEIVTSPSMLLSDYMEVGGVEGAFVNAALIGIFNLLLIKKYKLRINGLLIAAFMTVLGFSFLGKNIFNIVPIYIGGFLFSKVKKISFKDIAPVIMFGTSLAPFVSGIAFSNYLDSKISFLIGISFGVFIGFIITPLSSHMLKFHDGFNLYNIGFTAGIIGTIIASILISMGMDLQQVNIVYKEVNIYIYLFMIFVFLYLIIVGFIINPNIISTYKQVIKYKGRVVTDFTQLVGYGLTFFNMGLMGILCTIYVIIFGEAFNGGVMAAVCTVVGFSAFGKHPKNSYPVVLGAMLAAVIYGFDFSSTEIVITVLFSTTIAPIAGSYGVIIGIIAGMLHMTLVANISVLHGGFNLYNNGFSGGLIGGFLPPIVNSFKKGDRK